VEFLDPGNGYDDDKLDVYKWFREEGYYLREGDMFAHARSLATVVRSSKTAFEPWPAMRLLLEILSRAKLFVHFTSWGISHVLIGALKATSMHVPVYGIVSNVENHARVELTEFPKESPRLNVQVVPSSQGIYDAPHQKILIVDGLLAFKGSTNLTNAGMRRADRALDVTEVETNVGGVGELNNKYFAPVWKKLTAPDDIYQMRWLPF
jgi:hypothetical protein